MGYKDKSIQGEYPECGAIFISNIQTKKECLKRKLFGLPPNMSDFVLHVKKGMTLFLFEFERRLLYGVYRATSNGEISIEPNAFKSSGKQFPAQVRFTSVWNCSPLAEHEFQDAIWDNYYSEKKFRFGLNKHQVSKLMMLFRSKKIPKDHPERNVRIYGDKPAEVDARFGDLRKDLRDRLGVVHEEVGHGLGICEFVREGKEVDDHENLNEKIVEVDHFEARRGQVSNRDRFVAHYMTRSNEFGDYSTRQGKHQDHSFGKLRRVAGDADLSLMSDVKDGYENNNLREMREISNEDSFFKIKMEKIKDENDFEDGYIPIFTEPLGKHHGEIGIAHNDVKFLMDDKNKNTMDYSRIEDGYNVRQCYGQYLSPHRLYSSSGGENRTSDKYVFGHDAVKTGQRTLTEHEHPLFKPRGTSVERKPNIDKNFGFESFTPTTYSSVWAPDLANSAPSQTNRNSYLRSCDPSRIEDPSVRDSPSYFADGSSFIPLNNSPFSAPSQTNRNSYLRSCDPSRIEDPSVRDSPSYFADGSSFIPVNNSPIYPSYVEIPTVSPLRKSSSYYSHNEGSIQYSDGFGYASPSKSQHIVEGNLLYEVAAQEGSQSPLFPDFISRKHLPYDAGICVREEDSINKRPFQSCEHKHHNGPEKRVSVFSRLTSALRHEQEIETDEKRDLDGSVNKVMKMLEKVVSSPTKKTGKSKSARKQDDDDDDNPMNSKIVDYELSKVKMDPYATDLEDEVIEGGSPLEETRLVDFKRRKKANKSIDDSCIANSECSIAVTSDMGTRKRRKLVRPAFVDNESNADAIIADKNTDMLPSFCEDTPKYDCISTKTELKVDESIKSFDLNLPPTSHDCTPFNDDSISTIAVVESSGKLDASIESVRLPAEDGNSEKCSVTNIFVEGTHVAPSKDDSISTIAVVESSEKVDASIKSVKLPAEDRNSEKCLAKDIFEESTHVASSKDDNISTKAFLESSEKADASFKSVQRPAEDGNLENSSVAGLFVESTHVASSKDEATIAVVESSEKVDASMVSVQRPAEDGNSEKRPVTDAFVEETHVASSKDDDKMCGWIEW